MLKRIFTLFLAILLLPMTVSWAIDCKKANLKWEIFVCNNPRLVQLDSQMNEAYKACMDLKRRDRIRIEQKKWLKNLSKVKLKEGLDYPPESRLTEAYSSRIAALRKHYFDIKRAHTVSSIVNGQEISFRWVIETVGKDILIKYPFLETKENNHIINEVNYKITEDSLSYLSSAKDSYLCKSPSPIDDKINYSIIAARSNLFGYTVSFNACSRCADECSFPSESYSTLWDLETGKDIHVVLEKPFLIPKEKMSSFWKKIEETNHKSSIDLMECRRFFYNDFKLEEKNGIRIKISKSKLCESLDTIPYSNFKSFFLEVNPQFIFYLPRFIKAGLISKAIGEQLLKEHSLKNTESVRCIDYGDYAPHNFCI